MNSYGIVIIPHYNYNKRPVYYSFVTFCREELFESGVTHKSLQRLSEAFPQESHRIPFVRMLQLQ